MPASPPTPAGRPPIDPSRAMPPIAPRPSTAPPAPRVGVQAQAGRRIGHRACTQCGYDLRGIPLDGRCPECGHPTDDGAVPRDGPLSSASPGVIRTVAIGCGLAGLAGALAWATTLLGLAGALPGELVAWLQAGAAVGWAGAILVLTRTAADPVARFNGMEPRDPWRLTARWTAAKLPLLAGVVLLPWIVARMPAPAGAAPGPPVPAGVLEVVGVVRTILLPFALLALGAGLAIVHRMAAWTRDGFAERTVHVAQWTIPIGAVALLALGSGWPAAWHGVDRWFVTGLFVIAHAPVVGGLVSLAASAALCVHHEREERERARRRAEARKAEAAAIAERIDRVTRG